MGSGTLLCFTYYTAQIFPLGSWLRLLLMAGVGGLWRGVREEWHRRRLPRHHRGHRHHNLHQERTDPGKTQGFGSVFIWYGSGSSILGWIPRVGTDPIWIQGFDDKKIVKFYSWKNTIFWGDTSTIYLFQGLYRGRPSYIQHFKTWNFLFFFFIFGPFLSSWMTSIISYCGTVLRVADTDPHWFPDLDPEGRKDPQK